MAGTAYEVWSAASGSVLKTYSTEDEALQLVRANFEQFGADAVRSLMIVRDQRGRSTVLWDGDKLVSRFADRSVADEASRRVG